MQYMLQLALASLDPFRFNLFMSHIQPPMYHIIIKSATLTFLSFLSLFLSFSIPLHISIPPVNQSLSIFMLQQNKRQQRPPSCLPCRLKKLKCDKNLPCSRCTKTNNNNHCVYPRQGTLGRPPKNTAFLGKSKNNGLNKLMIREFIFEHGRGDKNSTSDNSAEPIAANKVTVNSGFVVRTEWWILSKEAVKDYPFLHTYFRSIDKLYSERGLAIRKRFKSDTSRLPDKPRLKFNHLHLNYTWWTCMTVNLLIKRASRLLLETTTPPFLTLYILQQDDTLYSNNSATLGHDDDYNYFERCTEENQQLLTDLSAPPTFSSNHSMADPLKSLPPDQAINLINDFFLVHPHSILINKSKLVKEYWSDTANPFLLSVVYGTTQCLSKNLQGMPLLLWESSTPANRNPFLAYAYFLLESLPTCPSTGDYQATGTNAQKGWPSY